MTDLLTLATTMLGNFRTIRIPSPDDCLPRRPTHLDWWQVAKARIAARRTAHAYRDEVRAALVRLGHRRVLDNLEPDPEGGWRLHLFLGDDAAVSVLEEIANELCVLGDPLTLDPEEFVREQLGDWIERGIIQPDE